RLARSRSERRPPLPGSSRRRDKKGGYRATARSQWPRTYRRRNRFQEPAGQLPRQSKDSAARCGLFSLDLSGSFDPPAKIASLFEPTSFSISCLLCAHTSWLLPASVARGVEGQRSPHGRQQVYHPENEQTWPGKPQEHKTAKEEDYGATGKHRPPDKRGKLIARSLGVVERQ